MPTRPKNDPRSIAIDARRVLGAARTDLSNAKFVARITRHELDGFEVNIVALEHGEGARSETLHSKVSAGSHVATARGALLTFLHDVRDDAKLSFPADTALLHAFGVGAQPSPGSTAQVRSLADDVHEAAVKHPAEAAAVGLGDEGLHHLEDLIHAVDGTDLAHVQAATGRHTNSTHTDSLAHLVAAEAAHIRLAARRVFRDDEARRAPYARTLPRHEVVSRTRPSAEPTKPA